MSDRNDRLPGPPERTGAVQNNREYPTPAARSGDIAERAWAPGPWHLAHEDCANDANCMVLAHARTGSGARWSVHGPNAIWTHDDGNAELIALAPELAEALLAQFRYLDDETVAFIASGEEERDQGEREAAAACMKLRALGGGDDA